MFIRRLSKDIFKLLVHASKKSAMVNLRVADLSNFVIEVQTAVGVACSYPAHILPRIADIGKTQTRLEVAEKQQAILAQAKKVFWKQLE